MRREQTDTLAAQRAPAESLWIQPVATGTIMHEQGAKCFWRQRPQSSKRCIWQQQCKRPPRRPLRNRRAALQPAGRAGGLSRGGALDAGALVGVCPSAWRFDTSAVKQIGESRNWQSRGLCACCMCAHVSAALHISRRDPACVHPVSVFISHAQPLRSFSQRLACPELHYNGIAAVDIEEAVADVRMLPH